jgi:cell division protein FtsL
LIISTICLLFILSLLFSRWIALTIGLIILGAFGYIEKIFNTEITKRIRITLLSIFIILSAGNIFYAYYKEYNTNQKVQQAKEAAEIAKKQVVDLSKKEQHLRQKLYEVENANSIAQSHIANLIEKDRNLHQQLEEAENSAKAAKKQINDLSDYGEVATYTFDGYQQSGLFLSPFTPVSKWAYGYLTVSNNNYLFNCNPDAMKHYKEIINKYPKFPFPYLALSGCLLKNQDPSWKKYAMKAKSILEITTIIPLHCEAHDGWLKQVNKILDPNQINNVFINGGIQNYK